MSFPPAPWSLCGRAIGVLHPVERRAARAFMPEDLEIVPLWPGWTLGGLYLAEYAPPSTLAYHELIVFGALVRLGEHVGAWVTHIYVDHDASMAGGREIWGLPKERAQFEGALPLMTVRKDGRVLCALAAGSRAWRLWRMPLLLPAFGRRGPDRLRFTARFHTRPGLIRAVWRVPEDSPFALLGLGRARYAFSLDELGAMIPAPDVLSNP